MHRCPAWQRRSCSCSGCRPACWQRQADGWALQVPRLRLKTEDGAQQLDGLQLQIGKQLRVNAGAVQAGTALRGLAPEQSP